MLFGTGVAFKYALHGLSMDTNPAIMCALDGPKVAAFKQAGS